MHDHALSADVFAYRPSHELWSDGLQKRRFIRLSPDTRIDTSHMDDRDFPIGTRVWKEFARDGVRIETRYMERVDNGPDGWVAAAYGWDTAQREARLLPDGASDALESTHDVPSARACPACHAGRSSFLLGFSAVQLAHDAQDAQDAQDARELTLQRLADSGRLTHAPSETPGLQGSDAANAALSYLHAKCGHCHNAARPANAEYLRPHTNLDLWLRVARAPSGSVCEGDAS